MDAREERALVILREEFCVDDFGVPSLSALRAMLRFTDAEHARELSPPLRRIGWMTDEATLMQASARCATTTSGEHRCAWSRADDESDLWEGTCGVAWSLNDGTPKENDMHYCPRCGGTLESKP